MIAVGVFGWQWQSPPPDGPACRPGGRGQAFRQSQASAPPAGQHVHRDLVQMLPHTNAQVGSVRVTKSVDAARLPTAQSLRSVTKMRSATATCQARRTARAEPKTAQPVATGHPSTINHQLSTINHQPKV